MSLGRMLRERVTIIRMGVVADPDPQVDEFNDVVSAETARVEDVPAYLEQVGEREVTRDRQTELADWLLVLLKGTAIDANDRVEWGAYTFEVMGPPERPRTPRGEHHVEARLRHVKP